MNDFHSIPLERIAADPNQPRKNFDDRSLKELSESIKKDGVLSPIMIRESHAKKGQPEYIIVYGERRFRAAKEAGLKEIPAQVRANLSDEEAFDFQITENLQRKDVHPMEEAAAYKTLAEHDAKNTTQELAKRFAKSETYIVQRLSFNKLVPELQKDFFNDKLTVGHAVLLSRLPETDQKELFKKHHTRDDEGNYASVHYMADYINRNIIHSLDKASFDKSDTTLNPAAPACSVCPQRSGANKTLFPDIKENDRCFNPSCFAIKSAASFIRKLTDIVENKPEIHFLKTYYDDVTPLVDKYLKDHKIKLLNHNDFHSDTWKGSDYNKKAQGFHVNGHDAGKITTIYLKGPASKTDPKTGKPKEVAPAELIKGIQDRQKRSKELDQEKVWSVLRTEFKPEKFSGNIEEFSTAERTAIARSMYNKLDYQSGPLFRKTFKIDERAKEFPVVTQNDFRKMVRFCMFATLPPATLSSGHNVDSLLCLNIAKQYFPDTLAKIQKDQDDIASKRIERADARIASLKKPKVKNEKRIPAEAPKKSKDSKVSAKPKAAKGKKGSAKKPTPKKSKK